MFPVKTHPTPGSGIWGKVERWGQGSEGRARGIGPVYSPDNALKVTYGNVAGQKNFSPAAGFPPGKRAPPDYPNSPPDLGGLD